MKKLFLLLLLLPLNVWATTYYLDPVNGSDSNNGTSTGTAWKSLDKVNVSVFSADDIIDGQNNTFIGVYNAGGNIVNRLVVPSSGTSGHPIIFRNITIDGRVSFDGALYFSGATYTSGNNWSVSSGEVYQKTTDLPHQFFEDGTKLTPVLSASVGAAQSISRGQFSWYNGVLYYRATDGSAPASHVLTGTRRDTNSLNGIVEINAKSFVTLDNVTVKYHSQTGTVSQAVTCIASNHITFTNLAVTNSKSAITLNNCDDAVLDSSSIINNVVQGLMVEGGTDRLEIKNSTFSANGRERYYNGTALAYTSDGDNIGIGGSYNADMDDISIHDNLIENAGAPDDDATDFGAGIYLGTTYTTQTSNLKIYSNKFIGNHTYALYVGTKHNSAKIFGNTFVNNGNYPVKTKATVHINTSASTHTSTVFEKNTLYHNYNMSAIFLTVGTSTAHSLAVKNNQIIDNSYSSSSSNSGDLRISTWNTSVLSESGNNFFRSAGHPLTTAKVIYNQDATTYYDLAHVVGSTSGFYQYNTNLGASDSVVDPQFLNTTTFDLPSTSQFIDSGVSGTAWQGINGFTYGVPDVGAYEYQPPYVIGTDKLPAPSARIYQGDLEGRARALAAPDRTCGIQVTPAGGAWNDLNPTDVRPAFADMTNIECGNRNRLKLTVTPASAISSPVIKFTDALPGVKYKVTVDGALAGSSITGCSNSYCTASGSGVVSFSWNGSLSSSKTLTLNAIKTPKSSSIYN